MLSINVNLRRVVGLRALKVLSCNRVAIVLPVEVKILHYRENGLNVHVPDTHPVLLYFGVTVLSV